MSILPELVSKAADLKTFIEYVKDSVVSKTLVSAKSGTITLFAFDHGQSLGEHSAPYNAVVQIIEGQAELIIDGKSVMAVCGQIAAMPADVPHAVKAIEPFKMLLTMLRE